MSLPSRERGLKYHHLIMSKMDRDVAPLAGAWIEISVPKWLHRLGYVAPLAGAWIEISKNLEESSLVQVAPLAGAWIEIVLKLIV